mmetsp:Transcript_19818/g.40361  ORF Transcript_19818/g.40361 Transcript_19818/m.40361 type:complete len:86 (+) Transcript_19818:266-523(+)
MAAAARKWSVGRPRLHALSMEAAADNSGDETLEELTALALPAGIACTLPVVAPTMQPARVCAHPMLAPLTTPPKLTLTHASHLVA